ncbi:MAG: 7,8-didemethyl-8-hydroxy-5-deazariboflavin synthase subunit CofG [Methanophagales archaeon ANME-1-THS]|nr:MAG: 7,8-didemethyl-8-hydroxy-5-deazariboflavin synthase subunit CofG [Methanophagales archaeon ANME-1-THS]
MKRNYITFSKNIFIPVTNVCRNACSYCGFRARRPEDAYVIGMKEFLQLLQSRGAATEALFTTGESPEDAYFSSFFNDRVKEEAGCSTLVEYTKKLCTLAIAHGLLPHCNLGIVSTEELEELRDVNASMGLMLETTAKLEAHTNSPGKDPKVRLTMIEEAGKLSIPFTTGILVGIGEGREDHIRSLEAIQSLHARYGHIQEVIIQPFWPKPLTPMWNRKSPRVEEMREIVRAARALLPDEIAIQVPPNLTSPKELIELGASDLGGISERTVDYINPEAPWPTEEELRRRIAPFELRERLPIYPRFIKKRWYSELLSPLIARYADEEGLRRHDGIERF